MTEVSFPPNWLPDPGQLNGIGEGIRDVALSALRSFERADRYERTYVGHGTQTPVVVSAAKQLSVVCSRVFVGRAGEQQYQFYNGSQGKAGFQTAQFFVELSAPWPKQQGGNSSSAIATPRIDESRAELWKDGLIVFGGMLALSLGGVARPWDTERSPSGRGQEIAVGPLVSRNPQGGQASWVIDLQVEL